MDTRQAAGAGSWLALGHEITDLLERIDAASYARLLDFCRPDDCRWFFSGQGRSGLVAQMAAMRFMHLEREAHFIGEATAPSVRAGDRLVMISGSGETPVSRSFAAIAQKEGAGIALLTHKPQSHLARVADVALGLPAGASIQLGGGLFEASALIVLDSIALDLVAGRPDARAVLWHRHTNMQ